MVPAGTWARPLIPLGGMFPARCKDVDLSNLTDSQNRFIQDIAFYVSEFAPVYGIKVNSPIIAQACLESAFGTSDLAKQHNYFGIKTRLGWNGSVYEKYTKEEYTPGNITTVKAKFRAYSNMADGVLGYFVFLFEPEAYGRYDNLKGINDPRLYVETIKADGYATDSKYVDKLMQCISDYDLTQYDDYRKEGEHMVDIVRKIVAPGHGPFGAGQPSLFAVHSTANPGATAQNHVDYWRNNPAYAVHLVSDWDKAFQCVEFTNKCWQVGNGNYTCIGIEICEAKNSVDFIRGLEIARSVILQTLDKYGWDIDNHVRSHKWFTENYGGSDHVDPIPYFNKFGWTWDKFIQFLKEGETDMTPEQNDKLNAIYNEVMRKDDPTGRDLKNTTHEQVMWQGQALQNIMKNQDRIIELLEQIAAK